MTIDASSNVILCGSGTQYSQLSFGAGTLPAGTPLFLAKFDHSGNLVWSQAVGQPDNSQGSTRCNGVATDASGNIVFGGTYGYPPNFGSGPLPSGNTGSYVAKYTSAGQLSFALGYASAGYTYVYGVDADTSGNILVAGSYKGTLGLAGSTLASAGGGTNAFALQLTPSGALTWSKSFGDTQTQYGQAMGIAPTPTGATVIAGGYGGALDFGNGELPASSNGGIPSSRACSSVQDDLHPRPLGHPLVLRLHQHHAVGARRRRQD